MKINHFVKFGIVSLLLLLLLPGTAVGQSDRGTALGTAFTYQGELKSGGTPYEGSCDFQFELYDSAEGGTLIGETTILSVPLSEGIFTVLLDFGSNAFTGENRWLDISVSCPEGTGIYEHLTPRQHLTAAPYALYAPEAGFALDADHAYLADGVPWSGITEMPVDFADGVDNDTTYAAGSGLTLTGTSFSVDTSEIQARVTGVCEEGYAIKVINANGSVECEPVTAGGEGWSLTGNADTVPGANYLGTSDNQPLEIKVNGERVFRFEPNTESPNLIGGYSGNWLLPNMYGATISGGGKETMENSVTDIYGTVSGGGSNQAGNNFGDYLDSMGAVVGGGAQNTASGQFSVVSGGVSNTAGNAAAVGGGISNAASGLASSIGGGESNTASYDYAAVGGGYGNIASSNAATVGGGNANTASGDFSTAGGGDDNIASGGYAAVSGGKYNQGLSDFTAVGGGWYNIASAKFSTIAGGGPSDEINFETTHNLATDNYCTVGGGGGNLSGNDNEITNDATYDTVSGGKNNAASGYYSTVSGGALNEARSGASTIGGGYENIASGEFGSTVSGGALNTASGAYASIGGGYLNQASATYTTISGGGPSEPSSNPNNTNNIATDDYCTVGGGGGNQAGDKVGTITDATYATVSGGYQNTAGGTYATVSGGSQNTISSYASFIGGGVENSISNGLSAITGGQSNEITGGLSFIGGGDNNSVTMGMSTIAGGEYNTVSGGYAFIGGGYSNEANENYAAIGGGNDNTADGFFATIPGGYMNSATGQSSFAAGYRANANADGCFVWGDHTLYLEDDLTCDTPNSWIARATGGVYFYTHSTLSSGAFLAPDGSSWNEVSNRELKENFSPVDSAALLEALGKYPITTWNYKAQDESIIHVGMMADEFNSLIEGLGGEGEDFINSMDANGVALAAIQGLYAENQDLKARVDDLEARLEKLEANQNTSGSTFPFSWFLGFGLLIFSGTYVIRRRPGGGL